MSDLYPFECPYCEYEIPNWFEYFSSAMEERSVDCPSCGKNFVCNPEFRTPHFHTMKAPGLNDGEHKLKYDELKGIIEGKVREYCTICDYSKIVPENKMKKEE